VVPLTADELEEVINQASRTGRHILEPGLAEASSAIDDQPGALPLLHTPDRALERVRMVG